MTPAEEFRAAAKKINDLIDGVIADINANPYWWNGEEPPPHSYPSLYARGVDAGLGGPGGAHAAAMHPDVTCAIVDWLDAMGDWAEQYPEMAHDHDRAACDDYACDVMGLGLITARRILGTGA